MQQKMYKNDLHYFSARLSEKLKGIITAATSILEAPAGYGKTTAVRDFLESELKDTESVHWITVTEGLPRLFWQRFCKEIEKVDAVAGQRLLCAGFPTWTNTDELVDTINNICCEVDTYIVLDNLQFLNKTIPQSVFSSLINHGGLKLHLVMITQILEKPKSPMYSNSNLHYITADDLTLQVEDIQSYFELSGIDITSEQATKMHAFTEGWVIVVYLCIIHYHETGNIEKPISMYNLMSILVWGNITEKGREFLATMSLFDTFSLRQACYMLQTEELPDYAINILEETPFIQYEKGIGYRVHSLLLEVLREQFDNYSDSFRIKFLKRAGLWCHLGGQMKKALGFFLKAKGYKEIVKLDLSKMALGVINNTSYAQIALEISKECDAELKKDNIIFFIRIAVDLFGVGRTNDYSHLMYELDEYISIIENSNDSKIKAEGRVLRGEWILNSAYFDYPNIERMGEKYHLATNYIDGKAKSVLPDQPFMFGAPSMWLQFHQKVGEADKAGVEFEKAMQIYTSLTDGHGSGADVLYKAELLCMRGMLNEAEILAYKVAYIAKVKTQWTIRFGAALLLGRIAIARSDAEGLEKAIEYLEETSAQAAAEREAAIDSFSTDVVRAMLLSMLEEPSDCAEWAREGRLQEGAMAPSWIMLNHIHATDLIIKKKYTQAIGNMEMALSESQGKNSLVGKHYIYAGLTICYMALGNMEEAARYLRLAFQISTPDRLYATFVRFIKPFSALFKHPALIEFQQAIDEINQIDVRYLNSDKSAFNVLASVDLPNDLTEREFEVAKLAARGLHNAEIAEELCVSENTIKTHLKVIFDKLDVKKRAEIIKKLQL